MADVTQILSQIEQGDPSAAEHLLPLVYDELRKLAAAKLAHEKPGQTLQATALVHEAYLRMVDVDKAQPWSSRGHFFGAAAEAMRRILVDQARHKRSQRAGGNKKRIELTVVDPEVQGPQLDLLALDEALQRLGVQDPRACEKPLGVLRANSALTCDGVHDPRACEIVKLRFFAGLTVAQAAKSLNISVATAENDWVYAKSWLKLQLEESPRGD
jgi:RNA polymerase sigma factor (TIGR02999 family)